MVEGMRLVIGPFKTRIDKFDRINHYRCLAFRGAGQTLPVFPFLLVWSLFFIFTTSERTTTNQKRTVTVDGLLLHVMSLCLFAERPLDSLYTVYPPPLPILHLEITHTQRGGDKWSGSVVWSEVSLEARVPLEMRDPDTLSGIPVF